MQLLCQYNKVLYDRLEWLWIAFTTRVTALGGRVQDAYQTVRYDERNVSGQEFDVFVPGANKRAVQELTAAYKTMVEWAFDFEDETQPIVISLAT